MTITVKFFAAMRDLTGDDTATVDLPDGATVGELRRELAKRLPLARSLLNSSGIAVNHAAADNELPLKASDEVAVIPPVSGG
jgi:molybdopterin converting factor subunit 1